MIEHTPPLPPTQHRTICLSDLHLGSLGARADLILRFLRRNRAEKYLLVGDILDLWHPVWPFWTPIHQAIIDHLHARQSEGAEIIYVSGNHDPSPESAPPDRQLPVTARDQYLHETADGRRFLVIHGDGQDRRFLQAHILTRIGSIADHLLRLVDSAIDQSPWRCPAHRRSAIEWLISSFNALANPVHGHEKRLVALAREQGAQGVICGHFHIAALHQRHGLTYANCGDWVDSFTAVTEDFSGTFRLSGGRSLLAATPSYRPRAQEADQLSKSLA